MEEVGIGRKCFVLLTVTGRVKRDAWESSKGPFFHMQDSQRLKGWDVTGQDEGALRRPTLEKVGALLAASAQGAALGKCWVEGALHLPRAHIYKAPGFVPQQGHFCCCEVRSFSLVVI